MPSKTDVYVVTGNTGSGKNIACEYFEDLGLKSIDADILARKSISKGSKGFHLVVEEFGNDILTASGEIDRKKLGKLVFSGNGDKSKKALLKLESICHPIIAKLLRDEIRKIVEENPNIKTILYNVPLYFEKKPNIPDLKGIILVYAKKEICIKRIKTRDNLSQEEAEARFATQIAPSKKLEQADFVIKNEHSSEMLKEEVARVYKEIIQS